MGCGVETRILKIIGEYWEPQTNVLKAEGCFSEKITETCRGTKGDPVSLQLLNIVENTLVIACIVELY